MSRRGRTIAACRGMLPADDTQPGDGMPAANEDCIAIGG